MWSSQGKDHTHTHPDLDPLLYYLLVGSLFPQHFLTKPRSLINNCSLKVCEICYLYRFLPLDKVIAYRAVIVIVSESDGRAGGRAEKVFEPAK